MKRHKRKKYTFCHVIGSFTPQQQQQLKQHLHEACFDKVSFQTSYQRLLGISARLLPTIIFCTATVGGAPATRMLDELRQTFETVPPVVVLAFSNHEATLLIDEVYKQGFSGLLKVPADTLADDLRGTLHHAALGKPAAQYLYTPGHAFNRPALLN